MSDLVERLRFQGRFGAEDNDQCASRKIAERNEAADTIEQLQADKRELMEALRACADAPHSGWTIAQGLARAILCRITSQHAK